jgi:aconitate hydratase
MSVKPAAVEGHQGARVLAVLGDSVTTDHISPAGSIKKDSPAGKYLHCPRRQARRFQLLRIAPRQSRSHGARHLRQRPPAQQDGQRPKADSPGTCPTAPRCPSSKPPKNIIAEGVPLVILAGKEYGSGSSRDWAAKGPRLLGVRAVIAESYERIHRSNLVGMGILPLQFPPGENAESLKLTGEEVFEITGMRDWSKTSPPDARSKCAPPPTARPKSSSPGAHRHAAGSPVLRQRRHPAVCPAAVAGGKRNPRR